MGLLDQVLGGLTNSQGGGASPLQTILGQLLSGQQAGQPVGQPFGQPPGQQAGLGGLLQQFEQAGLGTLVQSWVGTGPNQPVSPEQLHSVLGQDQVRDLSNQTGMAPGDLLSQLSHFLPRVVDGLTPNGKLPQDDPQQGTTWV